MVDFWQAKREQLQKEGKLPSARPEPVANGPWWSQGISIPGVTQQPQVPAQDTYSPVVTPELDPNAARVARHQAASGNCPGCGSGNYVQPPDTRMAARCFDCGYTAGRQTNDLETFAVAPPDGRTVHVKQTASSQGTRLGRTAAEIAQANQAVEQSYLGR
jgi:hypothetical protein